MERCHDRQQAASELTILFKCKTKHLPHSLHHPQLTSLWVMMTSEQGKPLGRSKVCREIDLPWSGKAACAACIIHLTLDPPSGVLWRQGAFRELGNATRRLRAAAGEMEWNMPNSSKLTGSWPAGVQGVQCQACCEINHVTRASNLSYSYSEIRTNYCN